MKLTALLFVLAFIIGGANLPAAAQAGVIKANGPDFVWASGRWAQAAGQTFSDIKCSERTCTEVAGSVQSGDFSGDIYIYKITRWTETGMTAVLPAIKPPWPCRIRQTLTFDFTKGTVHWAQRVVYNGLPPGPLNFCVDQDMDLQGGR